MNKDVKDLINGSIIVFAGIFISKILTYLWRVIIARNSVEAYGLVSLFLAISGIIGMIATMGLAASLARYVPYYIGKNNVKRIYDIIYSYLNLTLFINILVGAGIFLFSDKLAIIFFKNPEVEILFKLSAVMIPFVNIKAFSNTLLISTRRVKEQTLISVIMDTFLKLIIAIILVYVFHQVLYSGVFSYFLSAIITTIIVFYFSEKKTYSVFKGIKTYYNNHNNEIKIMFLYSLPLFIQGIFINIIGWTDSVMIGRYLSVDKVGVYNAAYPTARLLMIITVSLITLFFPIIVQHYAKKELNAIRHLYKLLVKWIFAINFFVFLILFSYTREIIYILFGKEYVEAVIPTRILLVSLFIFSVSNIGSHILKMKKDTQILMYISFISATGNVLLNYLLIPVYGITGGAIATSFSYLFDSVALQFFADRYLKTIPYSKSMIYTAITGFMAVFGINKLLHYFFPNFNYAIGVLFIILSGITYLTILLTFKIISINEIKQIIELIKSKL